MRASASCMGHAKSIDRTRRSIKLSRTAGSVQRKSKGARQLFSKAICSHMAVSLYPRQAVYIWNTTLAPGASARAWGVLSLTLKPLLAAHSASWWTVQYMNGTVRTRSNRLWIPWTLHCIVSQGGSQQPAYTHTQKEHPSNAIYSRRS
jgi:hypothetical protein